MNPLQTSLLLLINDAAFGPLLEESLSGRNLRCTLCSKGMQPDVREALVHHCYDLVIIYSTSSDAESTGLLRQVRMVADVPVYVLVNTYDKTQVLEAYAAGADNVLTFPLSAEVAAANIHAYCKRIFEKENPASTYRIGSYTFDASSQTLEREGQETQLTGRESAVLALLAARQGQVVDKSLILLRIWHEDTYFNSRSLSVFVNRLRHKMHADARVSIVSVREGGYKLCVQ